jgi:Zn-dependent peptidase ImmA (M78 family)
MKTQFSQRLFNARTMAGFSMQELADKVGVSKESISRYEKGIMQPDSSKLIQLSKALEIKVDYFFRTSTVELDRVEFRKKSKLGTKKISEIKYRVIDRLEKYLELESILTINNDFTNPIAGFTIQSDSDIELAAEKVRECWKVGQNPIPIVVEMLEDNNVKVVEVDEPIDFDGLSTLIDNRIPVIVVNKNFPVERKRFTLLHELGHLLLEIPESISDKDKEKICHRFASAFLFPQKQFIYELGSKRGRFLLEELGSIQKEWGISISAIMQRAKDLEIIQPARLTKFYIDCNKNQYLKNSVNESRYNSVEESLRFNQLLYKGIAQELVSFSKASALSDQSVNELKTTLSFI